MHKIIVQKLKTMSKYEAHVTDSERLRTTVHFQSKFLNAFVKLVADITFQVIIIHIFMTLYTQEFQIAEQSYFQGVYSILSLFPLLHIYSLFHPAELSYCMHYHIIYIIICERSCYAPFVVRAFLENKVIDWIRGKKMEIFMNFISGKEWINNASFCFCKLNDSTNIKMGFNITLRNLRIWSYFYQKSILHHFY